MEEEQIQNCARKVSLSIDIKIYKHTQWSIPFNPDFLFYLHFVKNIFLIFSYEIIQNLLPDFK